MPADRIRSRGSLGGYDHLDRHPYRFQGVAEAAGELGCPTQCKDGQLLTLEWSQLELTLDEIKWAIIRAPKLKITEQQVAITPRNNRLRIYVEDDGKSSGKYFRLRMLKRALPSVVVKVSLGYALPVPYCFLIGFRTSQGLSTIARALISTKEDKPKEKQLLVEGYGLKEVMTIEGVFQCTDRRRA